MADNSLVLVKNAKGRYVFCDPESAVALVAHSPKDKKGRPSAYKVDDTEEYKRGSELAAGGQGEGVRGDKVLERTGEGLVAKEG